MCIMKILIVLLFLFSTPSYSDGLYVDVGIGAHHKNDRVTDGNKIYYVRMKNPVGIVTVGYKYKDFSFDYNHISSALEDRDRGINMISIKYRLY